jgi:DNA-binding MarR family transcriptional regulator
LVDRLEDKGLVKRMRSREDRRQVYVALTDKGKDLAQELKEKVVPEITRLGERVMGKLSESEAAALFTALGKLSDGIGESLS